jgi:hypothetical protein
MTKLLVAILGVATLCLGGFAIYTFVWHQRSSTPKPSVQAQLARQNRLLAKATAAMRKDTQFVSDSCAEYRQFLDPSYTAQADATCGTSSA